MEHLTQKQRPKSTVIIMSQLSFHDLPDGVTDEALFGRRVLAALFGFDDCYGFGFDGGEELPGHHLRRGLNHPLAHAGDGSADARLAGVIDQSLLSLFGQTDQAFPFQESRRTFGVDDHLVILRFVHIFQFDRTREDSLDRADARFQSHLVIAVPGGFERLASRHAASQDFRIDHQLVEQIARRFDRVRPFDFHSDYLPFDKSLFEACQRCDYTSLRSSAVRFPYRIVHSKKTIDSKIMTTSNVSPYPRRLGFFLSLCSLIIFTAFFSTCKKKADPVGVWRGTIRNNSGEEVAFTLEVKREGDGIVGALVNGDDRTVSTSGSFEGDTLKLRYDFYDAELTAVIVGDELGGGFTRQWRKQTLWRKMCVVRVVGTGAASSQSSSSNQS